MQELERLETWLAPLLQRLSDGQMKRLAREVARDLRTTQTVNIRAQRDASGAKWEQRKNSRNPVKPIRAVYKARDGHVRELEMSSWRSTGGKIIGYDKEAGGIRTMAKGRMLRRLTPQQASAPTAAQRRRAQLMMQGMVKNLQARAYGHDAVVQFMSRAERIARVHHLGLRDRVSQRGPEYDYPERQLLGFPPGFAQQLSARILAHLAT